MHRTRTLTASRAELRPTVAAWVVALIMALGAVGSLTAQNRTQRTNRSRDEGIRLDTTVAVERGTILDVTTGTGLVIVRAWDRSEVEVHAQSEGSEFLFSKSARSVRVEARRITRARADANVEIRVPLGTRVVVSNTGGDVQVLDVRGEVDANLLSGDLIIRGASGRTAAVNVTGDITISDIDGPIKVQSMTGEISVRDVRGDVDVSSSASDVSLSGVQANSVRAEVVQGEIFFDGALNPSGRYEFGTHSGDVHLFLPDKAAGTLDLQSFKGTLHSAIPLTMQPDSSGGRLLPPMVRQFNNARPMPLSQGRRLVFGGGGTATVTITTFNGDVHISRGPRGIGKER